jgi:energy-coupling factor transport system substrate-specific component
MNLWTWPFISGPQEQFWTEGIGLVESIKRYMAYYLVSSFFWDVIRAMGNLVLILILGAPTLRALRRFKRRFTFNYQAIPARILVSKIEEKLN